MAPFLPAADAAPIPIGHTDLVFAEQRRFMRKSVTLGIAIVSLAPLILLRHEMATRIYLAILVAIHVLALVVFIYRVPWRALFRHPMGLVTRAIGLVVFGGLLTMLEFDPGSDYFWGAITLLWLYHVGALALLHIRHRREADTLRAAGCPVGPFSPSTPGEPPR